MKTSLLLSTLSSSNYMSQAPHRPPVVVVWKMGYRWTSDIFQFKSTKIVGKGRLPRSENGVIIKRFTHTHLMPAPRNHTFFIPWFFKGRVLLLSLYVCGERGSHHHINRRLPKKEPFLQNCGQSIGYGWSVILYRVPPFQHFSWFENWSFQNMS